MSSDSTQPTILVKKADGTSVRMTMEEFKAYKAGLKQPTAPVVQEVKDVEKVQKDIVATPAPKKIEPNEVAVIDAAPAEKKSPRMLEVTFLDEDNTAQVKDEVKAIPRQTSQPQPQPQPQPVSSFLRRSQGNTPHGGGESSPKMVQLPEIKEDFAEAMTAPSAKELKAPAVVTLPSDVAQKAEELMRKITIPLRQDLRGRLQSLLQSRLKDVRTDDQIKEYLVKSDMQGGVGLTEDDARYIMTELGAMLTGSRAMPKKPQAAMTAPAKAQTTAQPAPKQPLPKQSAPVMPAPVPTPAKVSMQDVIPPPPKPKASTGPLEELRALSLSDFRRLGKTGAEAAARLLSKFEVWKSESYVFFMDAREAWQKSPLFVAYQKVMASALQQGKVVRDVLQGQDLKIEEFEEIVRFNSKLN